MSPCPDPVNQSFLKMFTEHESNIVLPASRGGALGQDLADHSLAGRRGSIASAWNVKSISGSGPQSCQVTPFSLVGTSSLPAPNNSEQNRQKHYDRDPCYENQRTEPSPRKRDRSRVLGGGGDHWSENQDAGRHQGKGAASLKDRADYPPSMGNHRHWLVGFPAEGSWAAQPGL